MNETTSILSDMKPRFNTHSPFWSIKSILDVSELPISTAVNEIQTHRYMTICNTQANQLMAQGSIRTWGPVGQIVTLQVNVDQSHLLEQASAGLGWFKISLLTVGK